MRLLLVAIALMFATTPAYANVTLSEIKLGVTTQSSAWTDRDDPLQPWLQHDESGASIGIAALFDGPEFLRHIYTPRIMIGANMSTANETNYAYADLYWQGDLCDKAYIAGFFGLSIHDGNIDQAKTNPDYYRTRHLGSRVLFHLGPEIGYRINDHWNVSAIWAHMSNGWILNGFDLDAPNEGIDQLGVRLGYNF